MICRIANICKTPSPCSPTPVGSVWTSISCDGMRVLLRIGMLVAGRRNLVAAFQARSRLSGFSQVSQLHSAVASKMSHPVMSEGTAL
jgi:hypothetical protein